VADVHNKATPARMLQSGGRSFIMSRIKGKNTKPELKIGEANAGAERMPAASHVYRRYYVLKIRLQPESHLPVPQNISINIQILRICFCHFKLLIL
jgi:hypothetical protein